MRNFAIGYKEKDKGQYDSDRETAYAHGAAMMVPMQVIKEVGLMSYIFFLYYEEADWCARIANKGYSMYYVHNSYVLHKESITTGKLSALKNLLSKQKSYSIYETKYPWKGVLSQFRVPTFHCHTKNAFKFLLKGKIVLFYHIIVQSVGILRISSLKKFMRILNFNNSYNLVPI